MMMDLEHANPFLRNLFVDDTPEAFQNAHRGSIDFIKDDIALTFRIDNDDAVQKDFIAMLKRYARSEYLGHVLSVPNILIVKRLNKHLLKLEERYYPSNSIGLAYVSNRSDFQTILDIGHHTDVNNRAPMILLPAKYRGLQTINGENAINDISYKNSIAYDFESFAEALEDNRFPQLDMTCLKSISDFEEITNKTRNKIRRLGQRVKRRIK